MINYFIQTGKKKGKKKELGEPITIFSDLGLQKTEPQNRIDPIYVAWEQVLNANA